MCCYAVDSLTRANSKNVISKLKNIPVAVYDLCKLASLLPLTFHVSVCSGIAHSVVYKRLVPERQQSVRSVFVPVVCCLTVYALGKDITAVVISIAYLGIFVNILFYLYDNIHSDKGLRGVLVLGLVFRKG